MADMTVEEAKAKCIAMYGRLPRVGDRRMVVAYRTDPETGELFYTELIVKAGSYCLVDVMQSTHRRDQ